ncbi:hypothetical protein ACHAC9_19015 [Massilia sp. CMS3.1]|uniref:hypothetical protein n=1 Tax=Massilia sp. CMS3.1 TaxID=3373083 RepID=UPI003EE42B35
MSTDGSSISRAPDDEPERINGLPARPGVFQTPAGRAISHLSWVERRRAYELWIDTNVVGKPLRERLFAMATSLPPLIAACPNERLPEPMRMGPDRFVILNPMPETMTQAEMDALFDEVSVRVNKMVRPCPEAFYSIWLQQYSTHR